MGFKLLNNNIAILTEKDGWFVQYAKKLMTQFHKLGYSPDLFYDHLDISDRYEIVFILSYFRVFENDELSKHKHNIVIHESDLPKGKGWSPYAWQIIEGKNSIPVTMFEANEGIDSGEIYFKDYIELDGSELYDDIKNKQALKKIEMCISFVLNYDDMVSYRQEGQETFYRRRFPDDSELDVDASIRSQFNLLRCVSNSDYPAFFVINDIKYTVRIYDDRRKN